MPKQEFTLIDFLGPVAVSIAFFVFCMIFSIVANWTLITPQDDVTKFEKIGKNFNRRWGVHRMSVIRRSSVVSD
ncbi:hypothetical protein M3Y98_01009700 [Aphelenchoides besseyi]|nr:hypothetical protein M3Y98_01009700 [Aphelenchoides besseyi]KAI6210178.1 hypothetical protein M3Y96_00300100 [Aphelenchoides besseyi]